jgi:RNA polymerase primary sigma factor
MDMLVKKSHPRTVADKTVGLSLSSAEKRTLLLIMEEPISYMPDDRFRRPSVMSEIMNRTVTIMPGQPLSTPDEYALFMQMNYTRHRLCLLRRRLLKTPDWTVEAIREILELNQSQLDTRSRIVSSNMGLVLAMAKRVQYEGVEFTDLISEGSMALLRATEKFDCGRGLKFSTYACQAIFKAFSRVAKQVYRYHNMFPTQLDPALEKDDSLDQRREETHSDLVDEVRAMVQENLADLSETELSVVRLRFSLDDPDRPALTLKQVGDKLGLTKERIRQIQNKALAKLREAAEERMVVA